MIVRNNIAIYDICWLNYAKSGIIGTFYEPENLDELKSICSILYQKGKQFDLIGHTSNIYFLPNYNVGYMVSTRKCNNYFVEDDIIVCECGATVSKMAKKMVACGIKGFEGLIDLPGTVGGAIYGNASCFDCSINALLISCELLQPNGNIITIRPEDLKLSQRSTVLKRRELEGVILFVKLKKELDSSDKLELIANNNHRIRKTFQPGPKDNIGSIYKNSSNWTTYGNIIRSLVFCYGLYLRLVNMEKNEIKEKKKLLFLKVLGAKELVPYIYDWNRYIWKDTKAHDLFWKFHEIHKILFKQSEFEIEIRK